MQLPLSATRPWDAKRKRVLYLIDTLNVGGTETQMAQAALRLHQSGHHVTVACLRAEGPLREILQQADISIVEFRKEKTLLSFAGVYQLLRLALFLRQEKFDVLHAHDLWANLLGVPAAWLARTPIIISSRRYLANLNWYTPARDKFIRMIYRFSNYVVVNSGAVRNLLLEKNGLPAEKVRILHNGVDVERFTQVQRERKKLLPGIGDRSALIAVVANMYDGVKGHMHLIAAASVVCRILPEAIFLLIGDGKERPNLEQAVSEAGLKKNVLFLGYRNDIPELLACCNLSVLPSEAEALPNALLEAMASGLPVVATRVGGASEVVEDGVDGLLVPPGNPQALAAAIVQILQDPSLATRFSHAARKKMRNEFSFDRLMMQLEQLYQAFPTASSH